MRDTSLLDSMAGKWEFGTVQGAYVSNERALLYKVNNTGEAGKMGDWRRNWD